MSEKTYSNPLEILELIREGTKKALEDLAKGQAMQMGANKNPGGPRGNYTGKSSIMKPQGAPKVPTAPKPPTALKPPMPPKPLMAKAEELEKAKRQEGFKLDNGDKYVNNKDSLKPARTNKVKESKPFGMKLEPGESMIETKPDSDKLKHGVFKKPSLESQDVPKSSVKVIKKDEASLEKGAIDEMKGAVSKMKDTVAKMPEKGLKMVKPLPAGEEKTAVAKPKALPKPQENYGKDPHRGVSKAEKDLTKTSYDEAVANGKKVDFAQEGKTGLKISDARPEHERKGLPAPKKRDMVDKIMGDMRAAQAAKVMNTPKAEAKKEDKPKMGLGMNKAEIPMSKPKMGGKDPNSRMMTDQAMGQAHKDATVPVANAPVKLPTPVEHDQRANMYSEHMAKSHFDDLGACGLCRKNEHPGAC